MNKALIGYSGFVGSTLLRQATFTHLYRSTNIAEIDGHEFNVVVCAGAPAQKWLANKEPDIDREKIDGLIEHLKTIKCKKFILISTVDVFKTPIGVNESTIVELEDLHAYGSNRRRLEQFVESYFDDYLIVRLPGLVGPGLRKNIIFDFLHQNNLDAIESRNIFQFYPMTNLWFDITIALEANLKLIHLTGSPISVASVAKQGFSIEFQQNLRGEPIKYDMQTLHAKLFNTKGNYQYSSRETIHAIRAYAQYEAITSKIHPGAE